ncbi:MAG: pyridoxamine 5'-phosphate oxidase family protein, partial [Rubrivivax sp.]
VLATRDGDGVDARSVVLREVDTAARLLRLYTDARSAKLAQAAVQPQAMLVLWSEQLGWQLRLKVRLQADTEGLAVSSRWAKIKLTPAAQDYLSPLPPGAPLARPLPERGSREHFAMLTAEVQSLDWLELHAEGHRRARFDAEGQRWLAP